MDLMGFLSSIPGDVRGAVVSLLVSGVSGVYFAPRLRKFFTRLTPQERVRKAHALGYKVLLDGDRTKISMISDALLGFYLKGNVPDDARFLQYESVQGTIRLPLVSFSDLQTLTAQPFTVETTFNPDTTLPTVPELRRNTLSADLDNLKGLHDGVLYRLRKFQPELATQTIYIELSSTQFIPWRKAYGALQDEFITEIWKVKKGGRLSLNARQHYLPDLESIRNVQDRVCAGGVVVLTIVSTGTDAQVYVEARSNKVTDGESLLTTIPRAFHDAFTTPRTDYKPETTVWREVAEELFDLAPVAEKFGSTDSYFAASPPVEELRTGGKGQLLNTGFCFELLKGNYTFVYLLFVEDPIWWQQHRHQISTNEEFSVHKINLRLSETREIEELLNRSDWTAEGYIAFVEGLRALHEQLGPTLAPSLQVAALAAYRLLPRKAWLTPDQVKASLGV